MAELATLQTWKLEAELALHKLSMGEAKVQLTFSSLGETSSVTFSSANVEQLRIHLTDLKTQIARLTGEAVRGPIYFGRV